MNLPESNDCKSQAQFLCQDPENNNQLGKKSYGVKQQLRARELDGADREKNDTW